MKILIIEDDRELRRYLRSGLEARLFIVDEAEDGERGLFLARTNYYDLLVLDYALPKLNGQEVLQEIRQEKLMLPVLVLTVRADLESKRLMFAQGADDYIVKPFIFEEFIWRLTALLRRPVKLEEKIIKLGEISLNQETKIVKRGNVTIDLTKKEYNLLEFFLKRTGQILSRVDIMEHVWDMNADPFSNSIEAHIMNLRKKINPSGAKDYIHTFAGRGYKFAVQRDQ